APSGGGHVGFAARQKRDGGGLPIGTAVQERPEDQARGAVAAVHDDRARAGFGAAAHGRRDLCDVDKRDVQHIALARQQGVDPVARAPVMRAEAVGDDGKCHGVRSSWIVIFTLCVFMTAAAERRAGRRRMRSLWAQISYLIEKSRYFI